MKNYENILGFDVSAGAKTKKFFTHLIIMYILFLILMDGRLLPYIDDYLPYFYNSNIMMMMRGLVVLGFYIIVDFIF